MSSPINDDGFEDDRLKYAPPWARQQWPHAAEVAPAAPPGAAGRSAARPGDTPPDRGRYESGGPADAPPPVEQPSVWLRAPAKVFEGDAAMRELTRRMTLDPQFVPEPPPPSSRRFALKGMMRFGAVVGLAAAAAYGFALFVSSDARHPEQGMRSGEPTPPLLARTSALPSGDPAGLGATPARLALVESRRAAVGEPVPLGVMLTDAPKDGTIVVSGLAAGARLSAGETLGEGSWQVPISDLAAAAIEAPNGFRGPMEVSVELRSADDAVLERKTMLLEWSPAPVAARGADEAVEPSGRDDAPSARPNEGRALGRDEVAMLVKRGRDFIANGDLAAARLVLRRAADGGDAQAMLLLGSTFDPAVLGELKVIGAAPDPVQARLWYQRAVAAGSREAVRRLEPLARGAP